MTAEEETKFAEKMRIAKEKKLNVGKKKKEKG